MEPPAQETSTSAFASASSRPGGVAQVHNLLDRLELRLQLSQWLNLALAGALVLSAGAHSWRALHPPQPEYFATTADGRLIPLVPISEPYVAQETLLAWVTEAVTQAYTLDYVHYRKQLTAMRPNFSDEGFKHHLQALEAAGTLEAIIKRRLVSQVVPTAPPVVVNQGVLADRYAWKIEMKLGLSYQGASSQSTPQALVAEVLVVRMPTHEVPRGLAVHQLITRGS